MAKKTIIKQGKTSGKPKATQAKPAPKAKALAPKAVANTKQPLKTKAAPAKTVAVSKAAPPAPASKSKVAPKPASKTPQKPAPAAPVVKKAAPKAPEKAAPVKSAGSQKAAPKSNSAVNTTSAAPKTVTPPKKEGKTSDKKAKKSDSDDEPTPEIIPIDQLPILPSDIHYKRPKGKLAPGAKRLLKTVTINPHIIKDKPIEAEKVVKKKEPEGKFEMEFILHAPIGLLYDFLTTPSGLAEWFADDVDLKNDIYTFNWDGSKQHARIDAAKLDSFIRLHWTDKPEGTYFEFRILADELTNEISLMITDFGDGDDDIKTSRQLWQAQIQRLIKSMGTY